MEFVGAAAPRTAGGFSAAVAHLGCDPAALDAVLHVETGGHGFDAQKRPKMLFEPHIFYAHLKAADPKKLEIAMDAGLAYPHWGEKPYPKDSYPHLIAACAIDEELALRSASWGLPQILGENFKAAGYGSAIEMVKAFVEGGEDEHLKAMASFIVSSGLANYLKTHNWVKFAEGYNGPSFAKGGYHHRLADAYAVASANRKRA
jgi:hypothetical protein